MGRIIPKLFPKLIVKRKRCQHDWTSKCVIYYGIYWRNQLTDDNIEFKQISTLSKDFFIIKESEDSITLGHMLNVMINFNKIVAEVTFKRTLKWFISTCGIKGITPIKLGMNDSFVLEQNHLMGVLDGIQSLKLCQGIEQDSLYYKHAKNCENETMNEIFTISNDENFIKKVCRSVKCSRVLNFRTHSSVTLCAACKSLLKMEKNDSLTDRTPFKDITDVQAHEITYNLDEDRLSRQNIDCSYLNQNKNPQEIPNKHDEQQSYSICSDGQNLEFEKTDTNDKSISSSKQASTDDGKCVTLSENDSNDIEMIFNEVSKDCPPKILEFLLSQKKAMSAHPHGRRWNMSLIRLCLTLWCRSPKCYGQLRDSGYLILPSQKTLQIYKNKFHQKPGINKELLHWMKNEALHRNLAPEGYEGGLIFDEMTIQSDLQFHSKNGIKYLIGFTDISDESQFMTSIASGKREITLATHVLQFIFLGFSGFRFPLFHFPTNTATASELVMLFWKIVNLMQTFGFTVRYISTDGAQTNRDFIKILLGDFKSISVKTMKIQNIFSLSSQYMYIIMDYSHIMKKIRNNILKSGKQETYKRNILHKTKNIYIVLETFCKCLHVGYHNPFPIHQKLSHEHFHLTSESKMRNKIAEDVLNKEMLHLVKTYAASVGRDDLNSTVELLENTSILVENFRDHRPISDISDERLLRNRNVLK